MFNQAELLMCQRRNDEAAQLLPEVLRVARAIQDDELVALVQREQAKAFAATGNLEGARDLLHRARDRFAELREPAEVLATDVVLAEVLLDADHLEEAGTALGYVVEASGGIAGVGVAAHRLIGRQYMAEGRHDEAKLMLVASLEEASRQSNQYEEALILLELDALERSTGVPNNGHRHRARQILDAMGVISGAERRKDLGISER